MSESIPPKVSVIIPVYNAEKFLQPCIDTILSQTYTNLEIITVNDGSTDSCLSILEDYQCKDSRIVIIDQANSGVSSARNAGIENANGDYIFFLDADDTINRECIELLIANIGESVVPMCEIEHLLPDGTIISYQTKSSLCDCLKPLLSGEFSAYLWGKLFRLDLIRSTRLQSSLTHGEDFVFLVELFLNNKLSIKTVTTSTYQYRVVSTSATRQATSNRTISNIKKFWYVKNIVKKNGLEHFLGSHLVKTYWILAKAKVINSSIPYAIVDRELSFIYIVIKENELLELIKSVRITFKNCLYLFIFYGLNSTLTRKGMIFFLRFFYQHYKCYDSRTGKIING
jgi:glycosyltransferase involved in cell wall biosynthesis